MILPALILRSSNPGELLLWCVVGFCAGVGLFFYGFILLQRRRLILDTPFSKIRSASMGMVEISGLAVGPYTMISPIAVRPCYYYRTLVWEWKQNGRNKSWVKVAGESMHVPFFVDDNTGRLLVDPRGADLDLHRDFQQEFNGSFFSSRDDAPANVVQFLARHGIATSNKIKVEEYCIKPKNSLFILGTLGENPGIEVGPQPIQGFEAGSSFSSGRLSLSLTSLSFSTSGSTGKFSVAPLSKLYVTPSQNPNLHVVRLSPRPSSVNTSDMTQQQKVAAALLKAGISNPAAWSVAETPAAEVHGTSVARLQVVSDQDTSPTSGNGSNRPMSDSNATQADGFDSHPPVVLQKGTNNKTFLISWRSQQEVARSLGWKCTLMIWGGPILALISLYFFMGIKNLF